MFLVYLILRCVIVFIATLLLWLALGSLINLRLFFPVLVMLVFTPTILGGCALRVSLEAAEPLIVERNRAPDRLEMIRPAQMLLDWSAWNEVLRMSGSDRPLILRKR